MKRVILLIALFLMISFKSHSQEGGFKSDSTLVYDGLYFGLKFGIPYLVGLDLGYLIGDEKKYKVYLNLSAQTVLFYNSLNFGAGYFIGKKGFTIGLRYSQYAHHTAVTFGDFETGKILLPEFGWFKIAGRRKNTVLSFQLGAAGLNFSIGGRLF